MTVKKNMLAAGVIVAAILSLSACGSSQSSESYNGAPAQDSYAGTMPETAGVAPQQDSTATGKSGGTVASTPIAASAAPVTRQIIRQGTISVTVENVASSATKAKDLAARYGGYIAAEDANSGGKTDEAYSSITVRIPADKLDAYVKDVSALGEVASVNITAEDVTSTVVDLDARIKTLQTSIDRLNELMKETGNVADLMQVEGTITQRQAELDSLTAQRKTLGDQVAMSSITVYLSVVPNTSPVPQETKGFGAGWSEGWVELQNNLGQAITDFGRAAPALLFFLVPLVLLVILVVFIVKRASRKHKVNSVPEPEAQEPIESA